MARGAEVEVAAVGHGVGGVEREVHEHLPQLDLVQINGQLAVGELRLHPHAARQNFLQHGGDARDDLVEVVVIFFAGRAVVQLPDALGQLARLDGRAADHVEAVAERGVLAEFGPERFAQRHDAGHDVAEIMRQTHRQRAEVFLPRQVQQPAFGDGLPADVEPDAFVAEQETVAAEHGLAMFPEVADPAGLHVADAKGAGQFRRQTRRFAQPGHERRGVGLVDRLPEKFRVPLPFGGRNAGQLLDARADEGETEIGPLAENDARPAMDQIFQLHLGAQHPLERIVDGDAAPGIFRK